MKYDLKKIIEEAKKCGIEYIDTTIFETPSAKSIDEQSYAHELSTQAMVRDEDFDSLKIDWEYIKKVIGLTETKYKDTTPQGQLWEIMEIFFKRWVIQENMRF